MKASGIYEILNTVNGKRYVGSAKCFKTRFAVHRHHLRRGQHHSLILQRAWLKYGETAFKFRKLIFCAPKDLIFYEQRAIDAYNPEYNIAQVAGSCLGIKHSAESRAKMSASAKLKVLTPEHRSHIGTAQRGKIVSIETREKISAARMGNTVWLGKTHTPETKKKMSAWQLGKPKGARSLASREKQAATIRGVPKTLEHRAKIAAANTGKTWSPETRAKLTGRPCSPETRAKISAAQIARLQLRRSPC